MNMFRQIAISSMLVLAGGIVSAGQPLETETARVLPMRTFEMDTTLEYQTSSEGKETAVPFAFEYGISNKLELMVEPVVYSSIRPDKGLNATGAGDIEVTLTYLFHKESGAAPAFAVAGEVKIPTAQNELIGTGKTDYATYFIATKRIGKTDFHGNIGYTILGKPTGIELKNIVNYAVAAEYHANPKFDLVGEVVGNTSSSNVAEGGIAVTPGVPITAELTGAELTAMIGGRYFINHTFILALGITYDNNKAVLIRPGLTVRF